MWTRFDCGLHLDLFLGAEHPRELVRDQPIARVVCAPREHSLVLVAVHETLVTETRVVSLIHKGTTAMWAMAIVCSGITLSHVAIIAPGIDLRNLLRFGSLPD
jgi:hypothetical protein